MLKELLIIEREKEFVPDDRAVEFSAKLVGVIGRVQL